MNISERAAAQRESDRQNNGQFGAKTHAENDSAILAQGQGSACDECDEQATQFWPDLRTPVQMCDGCAHDAFRSGWEPGA